MAQWRGEDEEMEPSLLFPFATKGGYISSVRLTHAHAHTHRLQITYKWNAELINNDTIIGNMISICNTLSHTLNDLR